MARSEETITFNQFKIPIIRSGYCFETGSGTGTLGYLSLASRKISWSNNMKSHLLHETIGRLIRSDDFSNEGKIQVLMDTACDKENRRRISLCKQTTGDPIRYFDVDMLIAIGGRAKVIIEIEESNVKPVQIFGKLFASAFSDYFKYSGQESDIPSPIDKAILFVQILDSSKLNVEQSRKTVQWAHIQRSIQESLKSPYGRIKKYILFQGTPRDFKQDAEKGRRLIEKIKEFLEKNP